MSQPLPADPQAAERVRALGMKTHPEGGWFRETFRSSTRVQIAGGTRAALTDILFLLAPGEISHWHRVAHDEVWHLLEGGPLELLQIVENGAAGALTSGLLTGAGQGGALHAVVPGGAWQSARTPAGYALVACTVAPGFDYEDFALLREHPAKAERLLAKHPELRGLL